MLLDMVAWKEEVSQGLNLTQRITVSEGMLRPGDSVFQLVVQYQRISLEMIYISFQESIFYRALKEPQSLNFFQLSNNIF